MTLNSTIEQFYIDSLDYSGIELKDNIFTNKSEKLGDITIDGKSITLPYFENLKNPDGKVIFHLLNENYTNPETTVFNLYKKKLILELNLKLSSLIISLVNISSDIQLQKKVRSSKLINLIASLGEIDHSLIEAFVGLVKASKKVNEEAFILDIFLKKNGEVKDVPYAAIGKVNFHLFNEINKSIEDKERDYRVYGYKLRKKDLLSLQTIFNVIFPAISEKDAYTEGTDNKIFRYLNILLKTSYPVASRMNELAELLDEIKEPSLCIEEIKSNLNWANYLETLYDMSSEIRIIPSQTDISIEKNKLKLDESKANVSETSQQQYQPPVFIPQMSQQPPIQQQPLVPQPPQPLTPEDIIRGSMGSGQMYTPSGLSIDQLRSQPLINLQQPSQGTFTPPWVQQEMSAMQQPMMGQMPMQQPMMQQPMMGQMPMQQPMMQQPMMGQMPMQQPMMGQMPMQQQMFMQQPMMGQMPMQQPMQPQSSLQVNPTFMGRTGLNYG